jgi:predicted MFS family arabinose efflux permease
VKSERNASNALFVVLCATGAQMTVAMSNIVLPTIAPKVAETLGASPVWIGYQVSLTFGVAAFASMFGGVAVLRWGAARANQASMALCIAGLALFALPHAAYIALGSIAIGLGMAVANPAAAHLLVKYTEPSRRNLMFSIKQTGIPLGGVVTALTAPALAVTVGWQWSLAMIGAFAALQIALLQRRRGEWDDDRKPGAGVRDEPLGGLSLVWRNASLRWTSLVALAFSAIQRCLLTFVVLYLVTEKGYGLIEAGVMLSLLQIGGASSRVCWGWLADRTGSSLAVLMIICVVMTACTIALIALDPEWPRSLIYALFLVLGATAVGWNGVFHAEAARQSPPGMVSVISGGTSVFVYGGVLVGPAAFAAAYGGIGSYGGTMALLVAAGVAGFSLLMMAQSAGRARRTGR